MIDGGYEVGYEKCDCFWGTEPGSLVRLLPSLLPSLEKLKVLDAGCGEGKNAGFLSKQGAHVRAIDVSEKALKNGQRAFGRTATLRWEQGDIRTMAFKPDEYDVVIAYGLFHCFETPLQIFDTIAKFKLITAGAGLHLLCAFNNRFQDLSAHPGFKPTLIRHDEYLGAYRDWDIVFATDSDLTEIHPHNGIEHRHSMTRIISRRLK